MELIAPENFFYTILLFFSSCVAFKPPEPVVIETPRSVISQKLTSPAANEILLMFQFDKSGNIFYTIVSSETKVATHVLALESKILQSGIEEAIQQSKKKEKKLVVMIKGDNSASSKQFQILTEALKKNGIYRFNLITDPEK